MKVAIMMARMTCPGVSSFFLVRYPGGKVRQGILTSIPAIGMRPIRNHQPLHPMFCSRRIVSTADPAIPRIAIMPAISALVLTCAKLYRGLWCQKERPYKRVVRCQGVRYSLV